MCFGILNYLDQFAHDVIRSGLVRIGLRSYRSSLNEGAKCLVPIDSVPGCDVFVVGRNSDPVPAASRLLGRITHSPF